MKDDQQLISTGIAREAHNSPAFKTMAEKGLIDFLRQQITDAEWTIARSKAEIEAYEKAISAIERRSGAPAPGEGADRCSDRT